MSVLIHHRVAAQAAARPDAPAVVCAVGALNYRALDEHANRLAHHLVSLGTGPESLVAVHLPRSLDSVVAMLAVLKAGGAYLPLDPAQPGARTARILADAAPDVLVTDAPGDTPGPVGTTLHLTHDAPAIAAHPEVTAPEVPVHPDNLAYVIHTSGSTGAPKGVMVPHAGLANLVEWHVDRYGVGSGDRTSHLAALGFDATVWEVWPTLASGATLHLPSEVGRTQPEQLLRWLTAEGITVAFLPTPLAAEVLRLPGPSSLRTLLTGGDVLTVAPAPGAAYELVNHYGPTEATVVATAATVPAGTPGVPPIGKPIRGVRVRLLDDDARPVPDNAEGELCISGSGLARGYLGSPRLTAERFTPDPTGPAGGRVYRTGDLATQLSDGTVHFHGRLDDQVQLRGFRVEPAEVAAALSEHPDVVNAAVAVRSGLLIGYVVPRSGRDDSGDLPEAVRAHAAVLLPQHMVPARVMLLEEIPVTLHGKVDRNALPDPLPAVPDVVVGPRDAVEAMVAETWYEVLELSDRPAHVHDDFYVLGGHSLLAHRLAVRLRDLFGTRLPLHFALTAPTIAELTDELRRLEPAPGHLAEVAERHRQVAQLSDEDVEALLAQLGDA